MSRYRKIDVKMWGDEKFCSLSKPQPNGQSLWQYLLTGPHSTGCPGIFRAGEMGLCENLNWPIKAFRKAFNELLEKDMVRADWKAKVIVISNVLRYDEPQSPNVIKKWGKDFDEIPECDLKVEYYHTIKEFIKTLGETFNKAFQQAFREPLLKASRTPEPLPEPLPEPEAFLNAQNNFSKEKLTKLLFLKIQERDPGVREPNWEQWFTDMGLLIEKDCRNPSEVEKVILWCQADSFWQNNILSPSKLRVQFTQLKLKMEKSERISGPFRSQPQLDGWLKKKQKENPSGT